MVTQFDEEGDQQQQWFHCKHWRKILFVLSLNYTCCYLFRGSWTIAKCVFLFLRINVNVQVLRGVRDLNFLIIDFMCWISISFARIIFTLQKHLNKKGRRVISSLMLFVGYIRWFWVSVMYMKESLIYMRNL